MIDSIENNLYTGNIAVADLVEKYGHPLYIYDAEIIRSKYRTLRSAFPEPVEVFYSVKANPNISIVAALNEFVQGVEVASLAEMKAALYAGVKPGQILFVGPSKSALELSEAVSAGIFCIVAESERELIAVNEIAAGKETKIGVAIRINPSFETAGSRLLMGGKASQFGIDEEAAGEIFELCESLENIYIKGIHVYVGTQTLNHQTIARNVSSVLRLARELQSRFGISFEFVDFGGGIGVPYFDDEEEVRFDLLAEPIKKAVSEYNAEFPATRLIMESGRFLMAEAGIYATKVRDIKKSRDRNFVVVSGGINHNHIALAFAPDSRKHSLVKAVKKAPAGASGREVDICGPLCTPNDLLGKSVILPDPEIDDLIVIMKSGAYGFTASIINFLSHPHPAEILVCEGKDFLIRRASTVDDLLRNQILVSEINSNQ
jgi:diaminopimelate decarboxylase